MVAAGILMAVPDNHLADSDSRLARPDNRLVGPDSRMASSGNRMVDSGSRIAMDAPICPDPAGDSDRVGGDTVVAVAHPVGSSCL